MLAQGAHPPVSDLQRLSLVGLTQVLQECRLSHENVCMPTVLAPHGLLTDRFKAAKAGLAGTYLRSSFSRISSCSMMALSSMYRLLARSSFLS